MTFEELLAELKTVKSEEQRGEDPDYLELVVLTSGLETVNKVLEGYFGEALKPAGKSPNLTVNLRARPYGGIRADQTMYYLKDEKTAVA